VAYVSPNWERIHFSIDAELEPEREKDENENDEPACLGNCNCHVKETGQNAC